jgi:hypothetical protein
MASVPRHRFCTIQSHPNTPDQGVARREWQALSKNHNAELAYWGDSLRASQEGAIRGVMPLGKDWAIPCKACLAASPFLTR